MHAYVIHTYIHTYTLHVHVCIHTYTWLCVCVCICVCVHTCMHINVYLQTYRHEYMNTYKHTYIHTHIHTYIHTYIHACMHACMYTLCAWPITGMPVRKIHFWMNKSTWFTSSTAFIKCSEALSGSLCCENRMPRAHEASPCPACSAAPYSAAAWFISKGTSSCGSMKHAWLRMLGTIFTKAPGKKFTCEHCVYVHIRMASRRMCMYV